MVSFLISLASNSNAEEHLRQARQRLAEVFPSLAYSEELVSPAVGSHATGIYTNQLAWGETALSADEVNARLKAIEQEMGRSEEDKLTGRVVIDLDLLSHDDTRHHPADWERPYVKALLPAEYLQKKEREPLTVTVITIAYNSASTIERTIQSVISQTYPHIEYIIIDGKSTDATTDIIRRYAEHVAYWVSEPDNGIYDAMNKGIRAAHGDLIHILNSDDAYHSPTIVEEVVRLYAASAGRIIHGNIEYHEAGKAPFLLRPFAEVEAIRKEPAMLHPTVFVPKTVYERFGLFDLTYHVAADYELLLRFYLRGVGFHYADMCITDMYAGGESDKNRLKGFCECYHISVAHGRSRLAAAVTLLARCLKSLIIVFRASIL